MTKIEVAVNKAIEIAADNIHGYDQIYRWGEKGDYDCSSFVVSCLRFAGIDTGNASYTGNLKAELTKHGFEAIPYKKGMELLRGDILLYDRYNPNTKKHDGHTLFYLGNKKIVQASINEKGTATGGIPGDQTGREISIGNFYEHSKGWQDVLRYKESEVITVTIEIRELHQGDICPEVGLLQTLLNSLGYVGKNGRKLTVDNIFTKDGNTAYALKNYQKAKGLNPDVICGRKTWTNLTQEVYAH